MGSNKTMFTFRHRRAFGDIRDVEVFSGPIEYFGKKVLYSIVHDATARIKAENEVKELNQTLEQRVEKRTRELEEANKELEAFAYSVSHGLRAPLRAIEGFSSLLDQEIGKSISGSGAHYLERIKTNSKKMSQLIDALLRLSRIGRKTVDFLTVDLSQPAIGSFQPFEQCMEIHALCSKTVHSLCVYGQREREGLFCQRQWDRI